MYIYIYIYINVCRSTDVHKNFFTGIMQKKPKTFLKLKMLVAFRIAYQWHDVGIQLGFDTEELEVIDENNKRLPVIECCKTLLSFWKRSGKNFTAEKLIDAVKQGAGNAAYAAELRTG